MHEVSERELVVSACLVDELSIGERSEMLSVLLGCHVASVVAVVSELDILGDESVDELRACGCVCHAVSMAEIGAKVKR